MTKEIVASTIPIQIEKLKQKGLIVSDIVFATEMLETYGYYNIINSYKEPYIFTDENNKKRFLPNTTFEQLFSLFELDHHLRNSVIIAMIDIEEHLRATAAEVISASFGTDINQYLCRKNYQNRKIKDPRFSLDRILASLKQTADTNMSYPIKYYRDKYNTVPPWILFKGIFFSTLVNYIRLFKSTEKDLMIHRVFGIRNDIKMPDGIRNIFISTLFLFLEYRNLTAHGGRIYNYHPKSSLYLTKQDIYELNDFLPSPHTILNQPGIHQLLISLQLYRYQVPFEYIIDTLNSEIDRHCQSYPSDVGFIKTITGVEISALPVVWVAFNSKVYHNSSKCGNSKNLHEILLKEAIERGFTPCQRCYKQDLTNL